MPVSPFFPLWAQRVADVNHAVGIKFLTMKRVNASDISKHHNGFLLRQDVVETLLVPFLADKEREKAGLLTFNDKKRVDGECSSPSSTRVHGGLNVSVYVQGGWRVELLLTRFDESGDTVLMGDELVLLRKLGNLREGDDTAIWMFRRPDGDNNREKFCFFVVKVNLSHFGTI
ncbi:hypothetical protein IEQ34_020944 [Dendrobium chrysotoxum]|uniref:Uncharacterized protein n=1 Tax=Dendrobium chrysotoxum TaxID=161865 RepID=A0AAV7G254_DENCH|nr:hypothetical protein IEQ34_020944 [Dendrobium chrysotoxum]